MNLKGFWRLRRYVIRPYLIKTPWWLRKYFGGMLWRIPTGEKVIYLTFDDGPHPVATPFVLGELEKYGARATFFCIGKNVEAHPEIYQRVLMAGHRVGNHTQDHLNGWKVDDLQYIENIRTAARRIDSDLFRPPYGRIGPMQSRVLRSPPFHFHIVMWDVLSADFDVRLTGDDCARNVVDKGQPGSIVVFHDSEKAFERLRIALPVVMKTFSERGYRFEAIRTQNKIGPG